MKWEEKLERYGELIEKKVEKRLEQSKHEAGDYHPFAEESYSKIKEFVLRGGKRIASCSTLLVYKGYTQEIDEKILNMCAGIELYRHSILVHDDLIDMDEFRRGSKTLHELHSERHDSRFGEGTAVFSGNILLAMAMEAVVESGFSKKKAAAALSLLLDDYRGVNESQILDLLFEYKDVGADEWRTMASKRAASLFRSTILMGAMLGGASEEDLEILEEAATNVGYSFDIQDDIIDTYADEEQYGRPPCGDIELGKKPLHVIKALALGDSAEAEELKSLQGKKNLTKNEVERARSLIRKTGGLEAAKETSRDHAEKARKQFYRTDLSDEVKEFFNSLIDYIGGSLDWYQ